MRNAADTVSEVEAITDEYKMLPLISVFYISDREVNHFQYLFSINFRVCLLIDANGTDRGNQRGAVFTVGVQFRFHKRADHRVQRDHAVCKFMDKPQLDQFIQHDHIFVTHQNRNRILADSGAGRGNQHPHCIPVFLWQFYQPEQIFDVIVTGFLLWVLVLGRGEPLQYGFQTAGQFCGKCFGRIEALVHQPCTQFHTKRVTVNRLNDSQQRILFIVLVLVKLADQLQQQFI